MDLEKKPLSASPNKNSSFSLLGKSSDGSDLSASYKTISDEICKWPAQRLPTAFERTLSEVPSYSKVKKANRMADYHVKIVVVGDGAVGKTCLLISYTQGTFPQEYVPTIFENYVTKVQGPKNKVIELALWDTAGQEEYNRLRPLSYTDVDLLLVCYSVDNKTSLFNVEELWVPEVKHFCPGVPIFLVGLKSDLYASDNLRDLVDPKEAELVAKKLGASAHFQCSAKLRHNIDELFGLALNTLLADAMKDDNYNSITKKIFKSKKSSGSVNAQRVKSSQVRRRRHFCTVL
ncbi:LAMI_0G14048g1_1 [Lachancea mirantina]|uniref:GTP-binding protein RHO4 n=1 Tax=Lachancea mirantina TaxID=1230905 RepID=A0A1G4KBZ8_9SACH|nr:LAMI_0G14048g1_1 [Lachancea mirantina]